VSWGGADAGGWDGVWADNVTAQKAARHVPVNKRFIVEILLIVVESC
jgi:hypothetical protein